MGIEKVQFGNQVNYLNYQNSIQQKPSFKGESLFIENPQDKEKNNAAKLMLGATALAGLAILGIAGYKGHLGKGIQKFLGGTENVIEKAVEKESTNIQEAAEKAAKEAQEKAAKEAAEKAAKEAAEKAAKEAAEKAAKEAQEKAAKEAAEKAAKEAEAKAAKEAAEKAAKEAQEKAAKEAAEKAAKEAEAKAAKEAAQKAYDAEMKEKLTPQVKQMVKDLTDKWSDEVEIALSLYNKAYNGFKSLKQPGDTLKKLDSGVLSITHKTSDGKKYQLISDKKDTDKLRRIKVFDKNGKLSHEVDFYRTYQNSRPIDIMAGDHICFATDRKTPRLVEWGNNTVDVLASERLNHIQSAYGKYYVTYSGNEAKNANGNAFWLEV